MTIAKSNFQTMLLKTEVITLLERSKTAKAITFLFTCTKIFLFHFFSHVVHNTKTRLIVTKDIRNLEKWRRDMQPRATTNVCTRVNKKVIGF
jgi:hypothetical protein